MLAELLIDSWRDQPRRTGSDDRGLPGGENPISPSRNAFDDPIVLDDGSSAPGLVSLIALGAVKWDLR